MEAQKPKFKKEGFNIKKYMESPEYTNLNKALKAEINAYPVNIDRECFKKTPEEKAELQNLKAEYNRNMKNKI